MVKEKKLLMGIENILRVASDLVDEVVRLKSVEECKILKEKAFMNQFTKAEQKVFSLAIDGHSISEIQDILHKEECTIKNQKSILKKFNASSMPEAVQQFLNLHQELHKILNYKIALRATEAGLSLLFLIQRKEHSSKLRNALSYKHDLSYQT
ncbi:helix-turn-helix transcriptional regulator [Priestia megaterium]|uniref:helix-turn-helix transcriptional regulator n=1 Tax=Priestia megaterium TaxID=1404 RepID=UPI003F7F4762